MKQRKIDYIDRYGALWAHESDSVDIDIEIGCIAAGGHWFDPNDKHLCGEGLFYHYRTLQSLLWPEDDHQRWSDLMLKTIIEERITAIQGPRDCCVAGDTRIWNPLTGESPTIRSLCEERKAPVVWTRQGPVRAEVPFVKGEADIYEVVCSDGRRFKATLDHRVLTLFGFVFVGQLRSGVHLVSCEQALPASTSGLALLAPPQDGPHSSQTIEDSPAGCLPCSRSHGGRPRQVLGGGRGRLPSPADVLGHGWEDAFLLDLAGRATRSPERRSNVLPSSLGCHFRSWKGVGGQFLRPPRTSGCDAFRFQLPSLWLQGRRAPEPSSRFGFDERHRRSSPSGFPYRESRGRMIVVQAVNRIGRAWYYDMTVPGAHHYFAEGAFHHNSKTHTASKFALTDYFCFPEETLILMSSTDIRGLEMRVWGDLKDLHTRACNIWEHCPGNLLDSSHGIFTDAGTEAGEPRDMRRGIICIPCLESNGQWKGLEKYTGIKQKRRRLVGDECQFMQPPYLTAIANLNKIKLDFKGVFLGNPIGEGDPLDRIAEPADGWDSQTDLTVTTTWKNRMGGTTIQLVGTDSPAITEPGKYPYLIDQEDIDYVISFWTENSAEYWNQVIGVRKPGASVHRVVTRDMVRQFGAQLPVIWGVKTTTSVYAIDASYGGDRCVGGKVDFGHDVNGIPVIACGTPVIIPIILYPKSVPENERKTAEDQIADFVRNDCQRLNIPPANVFYDSTGRGSLGTAFARVWSANVNPIEFGGNPTERPVCSDLFIYDPETNVRRPQRCDELYSKFVTELWFSARFVIEGSQSRNLANEVVDEFCAREWKQVRGNKKEVEKKEETKKRLGRSPDMADWYVIAVEGCRRLGFQIRRMEAPKAQEDNDRWKDALRERARKLKRSFTLIQT